MAEYNDNFLDADEFIDCVSRGGEVEFIFDNKKYSITHGEYEIYVMEAYNEMSEKVYANPIAALSYPIGDKTIGDILEDMKITFRSL